MRHKQFKCILYRCQAERAKGGGSQTPGHGLPCYRIERRGAILAPLFYAVIFAQSAGDSAG